MTDSSAGAGATTGSRGGVKVSVVVPVYNTRAYVSECLDSLVGQDMPPGELEVVAVDDGSTDGSGELLDAYARRHACVRVIHLENSGWPGRPRNVGRAHARGDYVFFADSDDMLAPQAVRRMHEFAVRHSSDVVVPKIAHLGAAPGPPDQVWRRTQVDADLTRAILTLGPWKLFRRRFLDDLDLWFPEGKVRLEDGILVTEAYLRARRVSLLADYEYYLKRAQPDGGNISSSRADPEGYTGSVGAMIDRVWKYCDDPQLADVLAATLYRRKALKWFAADRFPRYTAWRRAAWLRAVAALAEEKVPARLDDLLPLVHRTRSVLVRHGESEALVQLGAAQNAGRSLPIEVVDIWYEMRVPGLRARPHLVVAPGLRLVPGELEPAEPGGAGRGRAGSGGRARTPRRPEPALPPAVVAFGREQVWPLARRSAAGRAAWRWASDVVPRRRDGPRRPAS